MQLENMATERRNQNSMNLDEMSALEIVTIMNNEDAKISEAIKPVLDKIAKAVNIIVGAFDNGGRLIYMGAGTSGRLGVLDASECPPTFGVDKSMVVGLIAGGETALVNPVEGAEDSKALGVQDLKDNNLNSNDVVCGIAASGRTPYVIGGLDYAKSLGCKTIAVACNAKSKISECADISIEAVCGPEVLTGSTRLKSGTATKLILNMLTTASMVRSGKAYENLMVDVVQSNEKLSTRAENIVMEATGVDRAMARKKIDEANGSCKVAITMILASVSLEEAKRRLDMCKGHVKEAISL